VVIGGAFCNHRVEAAARNVCRPLQTGFYGIAQPFQWNKCYQSAIADAVAKVNSPMLTEVHSSKTGAKAPALLSQRSRSK
jgi:TctA family transporter